MSRSGDRDDLDDRLAELESTLRDLQSRLDRPSRRFRPPTPGELLRFTEEYTIPTVIAVLEANIRALELLRRVLRLADPVRAADAEATEARRRADGLRRDAADGLSDALTELRTALSEADLPEDPESRSIVEDARELSAEIDRLIDGSRGGRSETRDGGRGSDRARRRSPGGRERGEGRGRDGWADRSDRHSGRRGDSAGDDGPVTIEVTDDRGDDGGEGSGDAGRRFGTDAEDADAGPSRESAADADGEVDVEAELQSIKDELDGAGSDDASGAGSDDASEAGSDGSGTADGGATGDGPDDRPAEE